MRTERTCPAGKLVLDVPAGHLVWRLLRWPVVVVALVAWAVLVLRVGMRTGRGTWRTTVTRR